MKLAENWWDEMRNPITGFKVGSHKSNTRLKDDDFPEIKIMSDTLGFKMTKEDPNQNITFL
jgi:hypothetical protein